MASLEVKIEVKGLEELARKLDGKALYWKPVKEALDALGKIAAGDAQRGAPRRTGALAASLHHKLNAAPMPLWVAVRTNVVSKTGRRYPWILEFDAKYGHKNWLRNSIRRAQGMASSVIGDAVRQIEAKWSA